VDEERGEVVRRRPVKRLAALGFLALLLLFVAILWIQRKPIAADFIDRELARRGVQATYEVRRIGFGLQRLENLVLGDPRDPDLTARWVEVRLSWGFRRPQIALITARGVRLRGRLVDGRVRFGQVDRLLPPPSGLPFRFPDQAVDVADTAVRLDTPHGRIGLGIEGRGNLAHGFRGELAAASAGLAIGTCRIGRTAGYWRIAIDALKPQVTGPLRSAGLACGEGFALDRPQMALQATLSEALDSWRGRAVVRAAGMRFGGNALAGVEGSIGLDGDSAMTRGALDLAAVGARLAGLTAGRVGMEGRYALSLESGRLSLLGEAGARGVAGGPATLRGAIGALSSAGGTPFEPIGESLAASLSGALRGFDAVASLRVAYGPGYGGVRVDRLGAASRSGARLALAGGDGVTYYWPAGAARFDGDFALSGGGFPEARFSIAQRGLGQPIRGVGRVSPMRAGGAVLAFGTIRFTAAPGGATSVETVATLSGPIGGDGSVEGLVVPLAGRIDGAGGFAFGERCTPVRFRALRAGSLRLGLTTLPLCPTGRALLWKAPGGAVRGGAQLARPRFAGSVGESPFSLAASRLRFGLDGPDFAASDLAVRLGREGAVNRLDAAAVTGSFAAPGVGGAYSGLSGRLAGVPFLLSEGNGRWRVRDGNLVVEGGMRLADSVEPSRFHPLITRDFRLTLAGNGIDAAGTLDDPDTGTRIAVATISHSLATGRGGVVLDVPGIAFGPDYQPEQLTRLTTGVVALVNGVLKGRGEIRWDERGTTSSGTFSTVDMDLAASFGPVEGLSTSLHFTDLLGLVTAPGQSGEIDLIRAGIDVFDGKIRYQLLPGLQVKVESGRWPFAGGELILEETILDFSRPSAKRLTFRVVGLDAARFVQQMEFSNISATGTFDGIIPMVFDERGGRIEGGHLVARPEGGTLSYIGELTDKELGVYGKLAFDALKSLRYSRLIIDLNGSLEGEFVAGIELDGVARDPALTVSPAGSGIPGIVARRALGQLAKIPFEFNITARGPFRTLIATTRSLEDPTLLIQSTLPNLLRNQPTTTTTVQPEESEIVP
jgi:translocation and assembly module TamB